MYTHVFEPLVRCFGNWNEFTVVYAHLVNRFFSRVRAYQYDVFVIEIRGRILETKNDVNYIRGVEADG